MDAAGHLGHALQARGHPETKKPLALDRLSRGEDMNGNLQAPYKGGSGNAEENSKYE